jgi:multiple sugar transport system substrate-binding protein
MWHGHLAHATHGRDGHATFKIWGLCLLAVGFCLLAPAGCSKNDTEDGKTVVTMATSGGDRQEKMFDELIKVFEKDNPDIKIKRLDIPQTALYIKLQVMIAGKCAPDLIPMMSMRVPMFMHRYALLPLDGLMQQDPQFMDLYKNDFWPGSFQGLQLNGNTYVIPWLQNPYALYYNKNIFDDYNKAHADDQISYPDANWDLDKFVEVAKKLTQGEGADKIYGTNITGTYFYVLCPILRRFGVELFNPEGTRCNLNDPRAIAAMEWYFGLALKDGVAPDPRAGSGARGGSTAGGPEDPFKAGKIAMWEAEGEWRFDFTEEIGDRFVWDVAEPPRGLDKYGAVRTSGYECFGMSISSTCEHPKEAWRFISYLVSPVGQEIMTRHHVGVPVLKSLCNSKDCFLNPADKPPSKEIYLRTAGYGKDIPSLRNFQEVESAVIEELDQARFGAKDVASACRAAARTANKLLAEDAKED